jgi:hypothetical protein
MTESVTPVEPVKLVEPIKLVEPEIQEPKHELWSVANALAFLIFLVLVFIGSFTGLSTLVDIQHIKNDWANQRCSPLIMPFAGFFGENTAKNFEFCMGKIFTMHSAPQMDSVGSMFGSFTGLLSRVFNSISSMRNTIASLGGGINVIFQEFTDRITMFFFTLRMSAIRLKMLFGRIYAILFSVMYMGLSGITGMTSFTNTYLFSFLDTFCFPGSTEVIVAYQKGLRKVPIKDIKIGDMLMPGNHRVTATFSFHAKGQPMVKLGSTIVSTNHYVAYKGTHIKAVDHPLAQSAGTWDSDDYLYCLNTEDHIIPIGILDFLDYDETTDADEETMRMVEERINGIGEPDKSYPFTEYGFALAEDVRIRLENGIKQMRDVRIGDRLITGSQVVGVIRKQVTELCDINGVLVTPSTLFWNGSQWVRFGEYYPYHLVSMECISLIVTPNSQIELENGIRVRDYMELCSPDAELYYTAHIKNKQVK